MLLRLVIGAIFISKGTSMLRTGTPGTALWFAGLTQTVVGVFFILGLYTQVAALAGAVISVSALVPSFRAFSISPVSRSTAVLLLAVSLALFITGAGPFAFDLPI
jgi:uncharacterized membrane protein YphA (DoxX/SURF4 family)